MSPKKCAGVPAGRDRGDGMVYALRRCPMRRLLPDAGAVPCCAVLCAGAVSRNNVRVGVLAGRYRGDGCRVPDAGACPQKKVYGSECLPDVIVEMDAGCPMPAARCLMPAARCPILVPVACRLPPDVRPPALIPDPAPDACRESNANGASGRLWQTPNK